MKRFVFLVLMILSSQFILAQFDPSGNVQIANSTDNVIRVQVGFNDGTDCELDEWRTVCVGPWSSSIVGVSGKHPFTARIWSDCPMPDPTTHSYGHNPYLSCVAPELISPYGINWNFYMGTWGITVFL